MAEKDEKYPDPKRVEKEIGEFLSDKYGGRVKLITPMVLPDEESVDDGGEAPRKKEINFSLKPEELESYLDQYVVKQDEAKAILATKVCTHFNRIKYAQSSDQDESSPILGNIKNNILMIGPTGVGKTYMIKLIAQKIGVPFIKGDATKFSETGYVGGDVEDLVRDLVREADDDIELAQYGIIYIDEIDKIASSPSLIGPDVSRTGVQRALLKPMEETEVDLKVSHDPISMLEEVERYRKAGKRKKRVVNTKNILFIMSGAFNELSEIVRKRVADQGIGFGASIKSQLKTADYLKYVKPEDLIRFGFETEFIGRLPVIALFEELSEDDLYAILKNPNNPVILSKKMDFRAYGMNVKFGDQALRVMAHRAHKEGTGARALVSVIERVLLKLEKKLPSTDVENLAVTEAVVHDPEGTLKDMMKPGSRGRGDDTYHELYAGEKDAIAQYIKDHQLLLSERYKVPLTPSRIALIAEMYAMSTSDVNVVMNRMEKDYRQIKKMEAYFCKAHSLNVTLHDDAVDILILELNTSKTTLGGFYKKLAADFEDGLKLLRDRTGDRAFLITIEALQDPGAYLDSLVRKIYSQESPQEEARRDS